MRIGVAGPVTLSALAEFLPAGDADLSTYSFPYISKLVLGYLNAGHEVDVFTCSEAISQPVVLGDGPLTVYVGRRRRSARQRGLDFFRIEREDLLELMKTAGPDVMHGHWLYEFSAAALEYQSDALVTAHDSPAAIIRHYKHPYWWFRAGLGLRTISKLKNMSVVSPSLSSEISNVWMRQKASSVIPNGVEIPKGASGRSLSRGGPITFACIANGFDARKNTKSAIEAYSLVRNEIPNATLIMVGTGHGIGEAAHQWAESRNLGSGVQFVGSVPHETLNELLSNEVDVLVHTSVWEACSMAILEAQAHGIPVVGGAKSGGVPYTLDSGSIGKLVDVKNPISVARAMVDVVHDPDSYELMSKRTVEKMRHEFDFESVVRSYLARLDEIHDARE